MTAEALPGDAGDERSLKVNAAIAAFPRVASILVQLAMSPFIVAHIGLHDFGFWALLLGAIQVAQVADGGLAYASSVQIAQARGRNDRPSMQAAVGITLLVIAGIGALAVGVGVAIAWVLQTNPPSGLPEGAPLAVVVTGVGLAFTMLINGANAGPAGLQRWEISAVTILVGQLAGSFAIVVLLIVWDGVVAVAIGYAFGLLVSLLVGLLQLKRLGLLRLGRTGKERATLRMLRTQGAQLQIVAVAGLVNSQADRFVLLPFTTLAWIGAYDLGARAAFALRAFPVSAIGPVISRVAGMYGASGTDGVKRYYAHLLRITVRYAVAPLLLMSGVMYAGVIVWLGADYTVSAAVASILTAGTAVNILTAPGTATGNACGRTYFDRDYSVLNLGLKLLLSAVLGIAFGPWGVVSATAIALAFSSAVLVRRVNAWTGTRIAAIFREDRGLVVAVAGSIGAAVLGLATADALAPIGRPEALGIALITAATGGVFIVAQPLRRALGTPPSPRIHQIASRLRRRSS